MTATVEMARPVGPELSPMHRILLQPNSADLLDRNAEGPSYELPKPSPEDNGLMAVLDLGGIAPDKTFEYGPDVAQSSAEDSPPTESDAKMLLFVDLKDDVGKRWVEGCDIPEGASLAVIDARGVELDENGKVQRGVVFVRPGESLVVGRRTDKGAHPEFATGNARAVSALHLNVGVDSAGKVLVKDRGSTSGTEYRTGFMAREAVRGLAERHVHSDHFKMVLGEEAIENTVEDPFGLNELVSPPASVDETTIPRRDVMSMVNESQSSVVAEALSPRDKVTDLLNDLQMVRPETMRESMTPVEASEELKRLLSDEAAADEGSDSLKDRASNQLESVVSDAVNGENIRLGLENGRKLTEQEARNYDKAVARLQDILGKNGKGGGSLGEKLSALGSTPNDIITRLRQPGPAREAVLADLKTRTYHMYQRFEAEDEKAFLDGVKEGRNKPINAGDAENGETQVKSLDKVALLALAMLDGTFRYEDDAVRDKADGGNHRDAAEKVLADFERAQVVDKAEMYAESETAKKIFHDIASTADHEGSELTNIVVRKLQHLGDALSLGTEVLYKDVKDVERVLQEIRDRIGALRVRVENAVNNAKDISDEERTRMRGAVEDVKVIQGSVVSAGAYTEGDFWTKLANAARNNDTDGNSILKFRTQIVQHSLGQVMARDLRGAITLLQQYGTK